MSVLVSKLFQANMENFEFVFSKTACVKTCIYFAVMYLAVMIFNTMIISRYKLINLLTAVKKNEKVRIKNAILSIMIFIISCIILGYCYYKVTIDVRTLNTAEKTMHIILMGILGTFLVFWSLSGFVLKMIQTLKSIYLKGTNMFVLRQINNKINTTVISMTLICLMLFMTISILSSSLALRNTMEKNLSEMTPVDLNLNKKANLPEKVINSRGKEVTYSEEVREDSKLPISETLINNGFDMKLLKDVIEINIYEDINITWEKSLGAYLHEAKDIFPMLQYNTCEEILKISDYNKIAELYGIEKYELAEDEYIVLCDYESMKSIRNEAIKREEIKIEISGKTYKPKYRECKNGYVEMTGNHMNVGIILVPDSCILTEDMEKEKFLAANYNAITEEKRNNIQEMFESTNSALIQTLNNRGIEIDGNSKITIIQSSVGLATIITFIAIYLGIIFLIASSAILALKQLTESSDNKQRYIILRKIGCDEKMINSALFKQIGIFFMLPLIIGIIHSIFGIQFVIEMMSGLASKKDLLPSVIVTVIVMAAVYGAYFMATYLGSKNIIKEDA